MENKIISATPATPAKAKKAPFDYSIFGGMTQKEFKNLSFNLFLRTVELMDKRLTVKEYLDITRATFTRFDIDITPESITRVLIPAIARSMKKAGEVRLSFVTFKSLLKGDFATRSAFHVTHKAKAPKEPAPRAKKVVSYDDQLLSILANIQAKKNSGASLSETELLMLNLPSSK